MKRYTLTECYELLDVDPKTLRGWLAKAGIEPQVSKADPRVKYLSEEQLRYLAKEHERSLERMRQGPEVIPPSAYKLLMDQIETLDRQAAGLGNRLEALHAEALHEVAELETQQKAALESLRAGVALEMEEIKRVVDLQHRQHKSLMDLINAQNSQLDQVRERGEAAQAYQTQAMEELHQALLRELRQAVDELRQQIEALLEQRVREVYNALEELKKKVAADLTGFTQRMDQLATQLEHRSSNRKGN